MEAGGFAGSVGWGELGTGDLAEAIPAPGGRVVTAGSGGVMVWAPPRIERVLRTQPAWCLALHPDGERLAVLDAEGKAEVWMLGIRPGPRGAGGPVRAVRGGDQAAADIGRAGGAPRGDVGRAE